MHAVAAFIRVVKGWVWQKYTYPVFVFVPLRLRAAKPANSQVVLCHMHVRYGRAISYTRNALLIDKQLPLLRQTVSSALMLCSLNNKIPRKKGAEKRPISGAGRRAVWIVHARSWAEFLSTNGRSDVRWRLRANERKVWERHAREAKALHAAWWENQKTIPRSCLAAVAVAEQGRQRLQRVAAYAPHGVIGPRPPVRCAPGPGRRPCPVTGARGGRAVISQPRCGVGERVWCMRMRCTTAFVALFRDSHSGQRGRLSFLFVKAEERQAGAGRPARGAWTCAWKTTTMATTMMQVVAPMHAMHMGRVAQERQVPSCRVPPLWLSLAQGPLAAEVTFLLCRECSL